MTNINYTLDAFAKATLDSETGGNPDIAYWEKSPSVYQTNEDFLIFINSVGIYTINISFIITYLQGLPVNSDLPGFIDFIDLDILDESITVDNERITLVNDVDFPGNNYFYGTDNLGTRGWYPLMGIDTRKTISYNSRELEHIGDSDWYIDKEASFDKDNRNNAIWILEFDDSDEEGGGNIIKIPEFSSTVSTIIVGKPRNNPSGTDNIRWNIAFRRMPNNDGTGNGKAGTWNDYDIDTYAVDNRDYNYWTKAFVPLATYGLTAGDFYQFQIYRNNSGVSNNVNGDVHLLQLEFIFE